jgi:hypothetical protein
MLLAIFLTKYVISSFYFFRRFSVMMFYHWLIFAMHFYHVDVSVKHKPEVFNSIFDEAFYIMNTSAAKLI